MCTWERPAHLALALEGYLRQTGGVAFELVVADDGSGPETTAVVQRFAQRAPFPVQHVWHERAGHRRTTILNLAVTRTRAEQILYTDGDCVPAADLVAAHRRELAPGTLLIGGYVRVRPEIGDAADADWVQRGEHERLLGWRDRIALQRRHAKNVWQIRTRRRRRPHNLGLNMSLARADLLRVNGYDENYRGWGNEDGDLRERLKRVGVWPKSIWTRALVFHLDHPVDPTRAQRAKNLAYSRRREIPIFAENGIVKPESATR
jgi:glycosyltransferase involved in cell wall biosynthesis